MHDKKRKVIFVTRMLSTGGAERVISELSNEWTKQEVAVSIVQLEPRDDKENYAIAPEIEQINFCITSRSKCVKRVKEICSLIKILNDNPDATAISFVFSSNYILALCKFWVKNKIIISERNDPNAMNRLKRLVQTFSMLMADKCVFQTNDAKLFYPKLVQKKGAIIPNPINPKLPGRFEGKRRKVIVTAGRLDPQKNLGMLIDAYARIREEYPEYSLIIYGRAHMQGSTEQILREKVERLGLNPQLVFGGFITNLHEVICDSGMYVSTSDYEGISNSVLEALVMGIPTISTDCPIGGAKELIQNNINGVLVPVRDVDALYMAMKKIIEDSHFADQISREACKIRYKYPIEIITKMWTKLL